MAEGIIVKSLSGFYYVRSDVGVIYQCRARGNFRKRKITPLVGDHVIFEADNRTDGYVLEIGERKNRLIRPPVANVDQALLVFSVKEPDLHLQLLDKFLVHIEANEIVPVICLTKTDLLHNSERTLFSDTAKIYQSIGYRVFFVSSYTGEGLEGLYPVVKNRISVVAGQSGVGKSSLLNALEPALDIETGRISSHLGRGKHTTRHVELLPVAGGLVADTPGFSSLDFHDMDEQDLPFFFPEMKTLQVDCKFRGCTHLSEPGCAVKQNYEEGKIAPSRYKHYRMFYQEIKEKKRRY